MSKVNKMRVTLSSENLDLEKVVSKLSETVGLDVKVWRKRTKKAKTETVAA